MSVGLIILVTVLTLLSFYVFAFLRAKKHPDFDKFFYQVTDNNGVSSIVHDSGLRPSSLKPGFPTKFEILKNEYDAGVLTQLDTPIRIELGLNPHDLRYVFTLQSEDITEDDEKYVITILTPNTKFSGRKIVTPDDIKEELDISTSISD